MKLDYILLLLIIVIGVVGSIVKQKLTVAGSIIGGIIALLLFAATGFAGIAMMAAFFIMAVIATSWKITFKKTLGLAEQEKGRRTAGQVIANGGVAAVASMLIWFDREYAPLIPLLVAAAFASATADTLSSELGNVYGRNFYHILSFRKTQRGPDGVVSIEGTLFGILGAFVIAVVIALFYCWSKDVLYIVIAGTTGNIADSILGATLEKKKYLGNNAVNFLNGTIAVLVALLLKVFDL